MAQSRKVNIKAKHLVIGFAVLIVVIGAALWYSLSQQGEREDGFSLSVAKDGQVLRTFTLQEIKELPAAEACVNLQSAQHDNAEGNYKGAELRTLLDQADKSLIEECGTFICIAGDGYSAAVSKEDARKSQNVMVAYEKDGNGLKHFNEGGDGPLRLLITSDTYGNRSTKFLVRIECRK